MADILSKSASLLVPMLADDEDYRALATVIARLQEIDLYPLLVYKIDTAEKTALHHLAEQFHIMGNEGWLFAKTDEQKRQLIQKAIELHRYKGTVWSVREAINQFGFNAKVDDWFKYGGDPYYFRVDIELKNQTWTEEIGDIVYGLIGQWKNVRSHLDKLRIFQTVEGEFTIASAYHDAETIRILPEIETEIESRVRSVFIHNAQLMAEYVSVYPRGAMETELDALGHIYVGALSHGSDTVTVYPAN